MQFAWQALIPGCTVLHCSGVRIAVGATAACCISRLLPILDADERARHAAFRIPAAAADFAVAHALKRLVLADALKAAAPSTLQFRSRPGGKPVLCDAALPFSLSHSRGYVAVAWTSLGGAECGVDIEALTPRPGLASVIASAMTADEQLAIARAACPRTEFYRRWTIKEAYVKWLGVGLAMPFAELSTTQEVQPTENGVRVALPGAAITSHLTDTYAVAAARASTCTPVQTERSRFATVPALSKCPPMPSAH